MKPIEYEVNKIQNILFEMFELVSEQILTTRDVLLQADQGLSGDVIRKEKRVNAYEITIDREVEAFLAMFHPLASDLRFAIATLKISSSLERIGDHAFRLASFVFDDLFTLNPVLTEKASIIQVFNEIEMMLGNVMDSFESGDIQLAKHTFKQDKVLDHVNKNLHLFIEEYLKENPKELNNMLLLSKCIGKLERVGDQIKNMAEEVIFYHESKIIKHKKKNKRIDKKLENGASENQT